MGYQLYTTDELCFTASQSPDALTRELAARLVDAPSADDIETMEEEHAKEESEWKDKWSKLEDELEELHNAQQAFHETLADVLLFLDSLDLVDDCAQDIRDDIQTTIDTYPTAEQLTARAKAEAEAKAAAIEEGERFAPGFRDRWDKPAKIEYKTARQRVWHTAAHSYRLNLACLATARRAIPDGAAVRTVA